MGFRWLDEVRRNRFDTPVTPEVAGSSPVAPAKVAANSGFCCLVRQRDRHMETVADLDNTDDANFGSTMRFPRFRRWNGDGNASLPSVKLDATRRNAQCTSTFSGAFVAWRTRRRCGLARDNALNIWSYLTSGDVSAPRA